MFLPYRRYSLVLLALVLAGCASSNATKRARLLTPVALPHPSVIASEPVRIPAHPAPGPVPNLPERTPAPQVSLPDPAAAAPSPTITAPTNTLPATAGTAGTTSPTNASAPPLLSGQPWPTSWSNVWVPLETWTRQNGLGNPTQISSGSNVLFAVGTPSGMIRLKPGSQVANLLGHDCLIAFPPRLVSGMPYVHSLDLQKTLQPLLTGTLELPPKNRVIVLDPGHGGRDSGTRNVFGPDHEKVYTLDWARRLENILTAGGWTVILTRTNDSEITLADRVAIAEKAHADVFLSLHFNAGDRHHEMNGLETYCLTPVGLPSNLRRDFDDNPREVHPNNAHDQSNFLLASRLHRGLLKVTGATDRGVRRARFMTVLRGQNRPAVLIEGGYLSNPSESRRIATPSYRQLLAEAVAQALNGTPPLTAPAASAAASASTHSATTSASVSSGSTATSAAANP